MRRRVFTVPITAAIAALSAATMVASAAAAPRPPTDLADLQRLWTGSAARDATPPQAPEVSADSHRRSEHEREIELLAKATPDECFGGIGDVLPLTDATCPDGYQPKVNQAYVWGLAEARGDLWAGTAPNTHCLVLGSFLGLAQPHQTDAWACEFGQSPTSPPLPAQAGDWRPPEIFVYGTRDDRANRPAGLVNLTPRIVGASPADALRLRTTLGMRSAGSLGDVVILGGPALQEEGGINLFAFDTRTRRYLGSKTLPAFDNIRKWLVYRGGLYTAVGLTEGGGAVVRWRGSVDDPFAFEVVGRLDSEGAELAVHDGRLFVSTWPELVTDGARQLAGLWQSPRIPRRGLTAAHAGEWDKVWDVSAYEPDPVVAATYGGGALHSYGGKLFWGTMHVPFLAAVAHAGVHGAPASTLDALTTVLGTHRAITIFRGDDFGTDRQRVELLYGMSHLPAYRDGAWTIVPNAMGSPPRYGSSGFGNPFNNYTWTMARSRSLFVGTMDWSYLLAEGLPLVVEQLTGEQLESRDRAQVAPFEALARRFYGADLWRFDRASQPARPESLSGVGNWSNYGIRTMIGDRKRLYLGTANPMNLLTDPDDDRPEGGWELLRLQRR